jgi:hypothetical protein
MPQFSVFFEVHVKELFFVFFFSPVYLEEAYHLIERSIPLFCGHIYWMTVFVIPQVFKHWWYHF